MQGGPRRGVGGPGGVEGGARRAGAHSRLQPPASLAPRVVCAGQACRQQERSAAPLWGRGGLSASRRGAGREVPVTAGVPRRQHSPPPPCHPAAGCAGWFDKCCPSTEMGGWLLSASCGYNTLLRHFPPQVGVMSGSWLRALLVYTGLCPPSQAPASWLVGSPAFPPMGKPGGGTVASEPAAPVI